jgi:hypothetical protein
VAEAVMETVAEEKALILVDCWAFEAEAQEMMPPSQPNHQVSAQCFQDASQPYHLAASSHWCADVDGYR